MDNFNISKFFKNQYLAEGSCGYTPDGKPRSKPAGPDLQNEGVEKRMFTFLDGLRDSGVTNMFGAGPYLEDEFGLDKREAREILVKWMRSFDEPKDEIDRDRIFMKGRVDEFVGGTLEKRNEPLRTATFNAILAGTADATGGRIDLMTGMTPVDPALQTAERIAQSGATCKFTYGTVNLGYFCVLTKFDFTVQLRDAEGHPTRVEVNVQLTEKPTFNQELTNLPVIPNDPPEQSPPPRQPVPVDPLAIIFSEWDLTQLTDVTEAEMEAALSGLDGDPYVSEFVDSSYLEMGLIFGEAAGIEILG